MDGQFSLFFLLIAANGWHIRRAAFLGGMGVYAVFDGVFSFYFYSFLA